MFGVILMDPLFEVNIDWFRSVLARTWVRITWPTTSLTDAKAVADRSVMLTWWTATMSEVICVPSGMSTVA